MAGRIPCGHYGIVKGELCTEFSCVLIQDIKPILHENLDLSHSNTCEDVKPKLEHNGSLSTKPVLSNYHHKGDDIKLSEIKSEPDLILIKDIKPELKQENIPICGLIEKEHNYHKTLGDVIKEEKVEGTETKADIDHDETETNDEQVSGEYYCLFYIILYL